MAGLFFLLSVSFFLLCLLILCSANGPPQSNHHCPRSFECGRLGTLKFPFLNMTMKPDCGLFRMNCEGSNPTIQLGEQGRWFRVESISQDNTINVTDLTLQKIINSKKCSALLNLNAPTSPWFNVSDLVDIYKCRRGLSIDSQKITCGAYDIYYGQLSSGVESSYPCKRFHLPGGRVRRPNELFSYLNPTFAVDVKIRSCFRCHYNGGRCEVYDGRFTCVGKNGSKSIRPTLGLGVGMGVLALALMILATLFICYHYRRRSNSNLLSRNTSSDPYSKSDVEGASVYFGFPIFSYKELEEATNGFNNANLLGDGGFGTVYYGKLRDGREVAVKRLYEHNYKRLEHFMNEIEILACLRHKNLVSLYGSTSRRSRELLLVYEFISNGTLADHLHGDKAKAGSLAWPVRMSIAMETATAMSYLHISDIVHRDVKTSNILLDKNFGVKVADFGLSRLFPADATHVSTAPQGTPGYVDPEYHQCYQLTSKSDVYSFGVVLIELISSMPAVDLSREKNEINLANLAIDKIQQQAFGELIDPNLGYEWNQKVKHMTTSIAELAFQCLQQDKEMRPTMDEVLQELKKIQSRGVQRTESNINSNKSEVKT